METNSFENDLFKDASKLCVTSPASSNASSSNNSNSIPDFSAAAPVFPANSSHHPKPLASGSKLSKFGAVKVVKTVNFDEIEAKARIDREEADRRGSFSPKNCASSSPKVPIFSPVDLKPSAMSSSNTSTASSNKQPSSSSVPVKFEAPAISKEQQEAMDRLGMGMRKMNINQSVTHASNAAAASAKCKQQGISSEQFSSPKSSDNGGDSFVNDRLREIDTSKGISSDAFFGRSTTQNSFDDSIPDDDDYHTKSPNSSSNYANLSNSAKDLASRIAVRASSIDIQGMKKSISSAGSRLSAYLQDLQNK